MPVDIKLGKPKVTGVDPEASGLLNVWVPFEPEPPREWVEVFGQGSGPMWPASMHPPSVAYAGVSLRPPDDEVDMYVNALRQQVDATNTYDNEVVPEFERQGQRKEDDDAERQRRIKEAQRQLDARD